MFLGSRDSREFGKAVFKDTNLLRNEEYARILPFFQSGQTNSIPDFNLDIPANLPLEQAQAYLSHVNVPDLLAFIEAAARDGGSLIFLGNYSVGMAQHKSFEPEDAIFAIDGVKSLVILRETSSHYFRVICTCYVFAALELGYWNPETKKGRWRTNLQGPRGRQTRMINIY